MLVLSGVVLPGVVLTGDGAPRCGACGCWCSWEIKRLKSPSPAYNILIMAPHFIVWVQGTLEGMVGR